MANLVTSDECKTHPTIISKRTAFKWAQAGKARIEGSTQTDDGQCYGIVTVLSSRTCRGYTTHYRDIA